MKKLSELVTVEEDNERLVLLKVKPDSFMDLVKLGFAGNETVFRVTKGKNHCCTTWRDNGTSHSHEWGVSGYDLVSHTMEMNTCDVKNCIVNDFKINIEG